VRVDFSVALTRWSILAKLLLSIYAAILG